MDSGPLRGIGFVRCGPRDLGSLEYRVEVDMGGHASIVMFERRPKATEGDQLHLTLADGRMLDCQVLDASSYCAVVGDGPYWDRRSEARSR